MTRWRGWLRWLESALFGALLHFLFHLFLIDFGGRRCRAKLGLAATAGQRHTDHSTQQELLNRIHVGTHSSESVLSIERMKLANSTSYPAHVVLTADTDSVHHEVTWHTKLQIGLSGIGGQLFPRFDFTISAQLPV